MINKGLILKTAAVVSAVSVLIITGCQGGVDEAAAVKIKSEVKETSVVSEKDREEDIETVVRSNGLTRQDTEDLRDDNKRETASDRREPEVTVEVKQPEDEGAVAGEGDGGTSDGVEAYEVDSAVSDVSSISDMEGQYESDLWDGEYTDDEYVDESGQSEYAGDYEYADENAGAVESGEGSTEPLPEPEVSDPVYEEPEGTGDGWEYYGTAFITHFCPCELCCGIYASGYCASGALATEGRTVAAGYSIPFGTEVLINGNVYVVEDRGVDDGCFDIFVNDHNVAMAMGAYYTDVYIRW